MKKRIWIALAPAAAVAGVGLVMGATSPGHLSAYVKTDDGDRVAIYVGGEGSPAEVLEAAPRRPGHRLAAYHYTAPDLAPAGVHADAFAGAVTEVETRGPSWTCRLFVEADGAETWSGSCNG